jgi:hypothetical protein
MPASRHGEIGREMGEEGDEALNCALQHGLIEKF